MADPSEIDVRWSGKWSSVRGCVIKPNGTPNLFVWIDVDDIVIRIRLHRVAIGVRGRRGSSTSIGTGNKEASRFILLFIV